MQRPVRLVLASLAGVASLAIPARAEMPPSYRSESCNAFCDLFNGVVGARPSTPAPAPSAPVAEAPAPALHPEPVKARDKARPAPTAPVVARAKRPPVAAVAAKAAPVVAPQVAARHVVAPHVAVKRAPVVPAVVAASPGRPGIVIAAAPTDARQMADLARLLAGPSIDVRTQALSEAGATPADFAIVPAVALRGALARDYVAKLFTEEVHILAGPGTGTLEDLRGKPVSFGPPGAASVLAGRALFSALGVEVVETPLDLDNALDAVASGDLAGVVLLAPKPFDRLAALPASLGLHLVGVPDGAPLAGGFYPASLDHETYPALIAGPRVATVALDSALVAQGDKGSPTTDAVATLFGAAGRLTDPSLHPKWREVNFASGIEGATRLPAARDWLAAHGPARGAGEGAR